MAKEAALEVFQDTDHTIEVSVLNDAETVALDVSGWSMSWMLKKSKSHADVDARITKTTAAGGITVAGIFNTNPSANTQVVRIQLNAADTDDATINAGDYFHELKRTTASAKTIISYGEFTLLKAVHKT